MLFLLLALLFINALLVMTEMALVSSRKGRLMPAAERGDRGAAAAVALIEQPNRYFSTAQIGITLISILMGMFGEASIADDIEHWLKGSRYVALAPHAHWIALTLTLVTLTLATLVLSELVPKRLAQIRPEGIARVMSRPMWALSALCRPLVAVLSVSTDIVLKFIPIRPANDDQAAEDEVKAILASGTEEGVFNEAEQQIVERVFKLSDIRVKSLMVPRTDIDFLLADDTIQRVRVAVATSSHSHFPVCKTSLDDLVGVVHVKDLVKHGLISDDVNLGALAQPPIFLPESAFAIKALEKFRDSRIHTAFVLDEYGVLVGLITMNDVLDALLGEVTAPGGAAGVMPGLPGVAMAGGTSAGGGAARRHGHAGTSAGSLGHDDPLIVQRADGSYLLDGMLPVAELRALLGVETLPRQEIADFDTLGGFVMSFLRRIPHTGDTFAFERFAFEIMDMDRTRVDKVLLTIKPPPEPDAAEQK